MERVAIVLATTMNTDRWDLMLPLDIAVQSLVLKLIDAPQLPFRAQDDSGVRIPYRLMWQEGNRYLNESETLRAAGVETGHTLIMTHEARAGRQ
jgi:hypothetical protein